MKSMNIIWSINLFNFEQKRNKDSTCANSVAVRKIPNQAVIGSYYNGLIHQNTKNCLLMRSLSIFSFFEFTQKKDCTQATENGRGSYIVGFIFQNSSEFSRILDILIRKLQCYKDHQIFSQEL